MRARLPVVILLLLASGVAGYVVGRRSELSRDVGTNIAAARKGAGGPAFSRGRPQRDTAAGDPHDSGIHTEAELRAEFDRILNLRPEVRREAVEGVVRRMPAALFPVGLRLARGYRGMSIGHLVESAVLGRWLREDAPGAFAEAEAAPNLRERMRRKQLLYSEWTSFDVPAALASAKNLERFEERLSMMRSILDVLSTTQPALALAELRALHNHRFDDLVRQSVVNLAKSDPTAATREFASLPVADRFRTVGDVIRELARVDLAAAEAWVAGVPVGMEQQAGLRGLVEAMAVTNPAGAMEKAMSLSHREFRNDAVTAVFREWCRWDLAAAESWYQSQPSSASRRQLFQEWLRAATDADPAGAATRLAGMAPKGGREADLYENITAGWVRVDAAAASAWVATLPAGEARDRATMAILQHQALADPVGALEKALGLPQSARDRGLAGIFRTWMDLDSDAAVSWLKGQKPEVLSGALAGGVVDALADRNPAEAAELLLKHTSVERQVGTIDNVVGRWALLDLQGAIAFSKSLAEGAVRNKALKTVGYFLSGVDPESALELAAALPNQDDRRELVERALVGSGLDDPKQAAQWVEKLSIGDVRNEAIRQIVGIWSGQDPKAAIAWLTEQPAGAARRDGLGVAVAKWAEVDSVAAATFAAGLSDPAEQQRAVSDVLSVMSRTEVAQAAQWVAQFPENNEKVTYTTIVARGWAEKDPQAAAAWLMTLPADGARFQALQPIAEAAANRAPQWAWQWAVGLSDPRERAEAMVRVGEKWLQSSPESAKAAIQQAELPPVVRKLLLPTTPP